MPTATEMKDRINVLAGPMVEEFRRKSANMSQRQYVIAVAVWFTIGWGLGEILGGWWILAVLPLVLVAQIAKFIGGNKRGAYPEAPPESEHIPSVSRHKSRRN